MEKYIQFFYFCSYSSEGDGKDPPDSARGRWVTNKPEDVLKALGGNNNNGGGYYEYEI